MNKKIGQWTERLKSINQDNLVSVVRYNGEHLLILLKELNFDNLIKNSSLARKIQKAGYVPLFLTEEHIRTSCDVYPLEYLKMKGDYEIIYGKNILEELSIPPENIRLESEQKIKGALIRLTQVILEQGDNVKRLARSCFLALEDIVSGMEGMAKLAGIPWAGSDSAVINKIQDKFSIDLQPVKIIVSWKEGAKPEAPKKTIYDFYEKIEDLARLVDRIEV